MTNGSSHTKDEKHQNTAAKKQSKAKDATAAKSDKKQKDNGSSES